MGVVAFFWVSAFLLISSGIYLSSLFIGDATRGVILIMQYFFCFILLPHALMQRDENEAYRLIIIFILGVLALDIHGIVTFYTVGYSPESQVVTGALRLATLMGAANAAASLNAMTIVILLWLRTIGRISFLPFLCILSTMILALVLTSSNTGLIAVTTGTLIYFAVTFRPGLLVRIVPAIVLAVAFFLLGGANYLPATFHKRVLAAVLEGDITEAGTFTDRAALNYEALEMIGSRGFSLLGIGADQFRLASFHEVPVHNTFLILWVEGGVLSLAGWMLMSSMGIIVWLLAWRRNVIPHGRAAVLVCFVVFVTVASATAHIYSRHWYTVLLLTMQPTIIALSQYRQEETKSVLIKVR
ncbi:O-antigen ligase domain-containing protein [Sinorhizobium numidicum]|uniref:O-antigen ligase domain-containing protein n=1 Tax=Sinorhizobium numidicum TaxID=680248 RepID=A0ABY8CY02_9HYPH|nr:O-antigen ligase family protein [Sinorhizobium numidicum]WEX75616.1 O-antigen ligase domain-containing protein [Sinorhizobium numidicum]WEX81613.1 O-antigen ligase domain-containing protein [Sinorhizobium numidicum]